MTLTVPAQAYIDAGTGSMVMQAAVSGLLGLVFVARSAWSRLPFWLKKKSRDDDEPGEDQRKAA